MKDRKLAVLLIGVLIVTLVVAGCGQQAVPTTSDQGAAPTTGAQPLTKVTLRLPWLITTQFAGEYVALEKGYFKDEGLDVEIQPGGPDVNSITMVASGTSTFGLHDMGSLILARSNDIDVVASAAFFQKHPGGLMALSDSGINTLQDIEGKSIGFQEGGPWMLSQAMLASNGVDLNSIKKVAVGFDLSPLFNHQVDLFTVYVTNEPLLAKAQGYDTNVFLPYDYGIETSSEVLFTTGDYLKQNPDKVCGMVRAIQKGWQYAVDNKDEAVSIILAAGGSDLNKEAEMGQLNAEIPLMMTPETEANGLGYMTKDRWQNAEDVLTKYGQLTNTVDVSNAFTTQCFGQ